MSEFTALVLNEEDRKVSAEIQTLPDSALPEGDVTVGIEYSTLNYKDGMIIKGLGRLVRNFPHVPGIDFAGVVESSSNADYQPGDRVVLNGWRVGEVHWGGHATRARVRGEWLVPLPDAISTRQAMGIGTAGYTAMLAVMTLEEQGLARGEQRDVLVTGAAGGVGSIATAVLANLGYKVAASTGRAETHDYLKSLGASTIIGRDEMNEPPKGPLGSERWAAAIDNLGGQTLANVLAQMCYWGPVAAVGMAQNPQFTATVLPFLLRGVKLLGIDSNTCSFGRRMVAWSRLAAELPMDKLESAITEVRLDDVAGLADDILAGKIQGRVVIGMGA